MKFIKTAGFLSILLSTTAFGSDRFATRVIAYNEGDGAILDDPTLILGGPRGEGGGGGSLDVVSLGVGGDITVGFDVVITDGPGADFVVFENGFLANKGEIFSEVVYVEVSTDGIHFARFPTRYGLPPGDLPAFGGAKVGAYRGLAGNHPVFANVMTNTLDPCNPIEGGGEAFDLAELVDHPLVQSGDVDLANIHEIRLIDVESGVDLDSEGAVIYDNGGGQGNADLDAIAVIHHTQNQHADAPRVDLQIDDFGYLVLRIEDQDGLGDLDGSAVRASISTVEVPFFLLLPALTVTEASDHHVVFRSLVTLSGTALVESLAVSIRDLSGKRGVDMVVLQG